MSKRFGRNQKRRMREQISRAEARADRLEHQYRELQLLSHRNRQIVAETARVLGKHFITLPPYTMVVRDIDAIIGGGWRVACLNSPDMWEHIQAAPDYQSFMEAVLPAMYGTVVADDLSHRMHFVIQHDGKHAAYAVSRESLMMLGKRDAVRRIAEQMAEHLYRGMADDQKLGDRHEHS